jgi:hypothetical protein
MALIRSPICDLLPFFRPPRAENSVTRPPAANEQRATAIEEAEAFSETLHEITMAGLTTLMVTGMIHQRVEMDSPGSFL